MMQSIQSRLKSRRLLGVGEGADGQQHRSKITQILGNDSLTNWQISRAEYPIGLHALQWLTLAWFSGIGVTSLFFPRVITSLQDGQSEGDTSKQVEALKYSQIAIVRMYGAAMLGLASLCGIVTIFNGQSRRAIRILLVVKAIFCLAELIASYLSAAHTDMEEMLTGPYVPHVTCHVTRVLVCFMSSYYFVKTAPCRQVPVKRSE